MELNKWQHSVYSLTYHVVFVTKYRRPVITPAMDEYMKSLAGRLIDGYGGRLIEMQSDKDHVHLLMELPPSCAPATAVNSLKTQISKGLRTDFADDVKKYLWGDAFWSASYFICTTGGANIDTVKQYIESQQTEEHPKRRYEKSGRYKKKKAHSSPPD